MPVSETRMAAMSSRPMQKAAVTIPFRVRVSSQPRWIKESAIHPPIGLTTSLAFFTFGIAEPIGGWIPAPLDQRVGDPSSNRFCDSEREERQRRGKTGSQDAEVADRHEVIGQPGHQHIPIVIKAKKAQANSQ